MNKIKLGIIGCGGHACHHAKLMSEDFEITNVFDPQTENIRKFPYSTYSSCAETLLDDKRVEAVFISSPDEFHLKQMRLAIEAGKHVLCEKPLLVPGETTGELDEIINRAHMKNLVVTTCHPRRFDDPALWFMKTCRDKDLRPPFGDVVGFSFDFSYHQPNATWKKDRSLLLDHLNHEVDLMNFFFGIQPTTLWKLHDSYDHYAIAGKRADGLIFNFSGTRRLAEYYYHEVFRVRYEKGEIEVNTLTGKATTYDHDRKIVGVAVDNLKTNHENRLLGVNRNFAQQIRGGAPYITTREMLMNAGVGIAFAEGKKEVKITC